MEFNHIRTKEEFNRTVELYLSSFPEHERREVEGHIGILGNDNFYATEIIDDCNVVGLLFYWEFETYLYVEHFAIEGTIRGKNYGSRALQKLISERGNKSIILEIEPPIDEITNKRLRFYERLGFVMNDYYYEHPSFNRENPYIHELRLMSYPREISSNEFHTFLGDVKNILI